MRFINFYGEIKKLGGNLEDARRLDKEGRESAIDAHTDMWEQGMMPNIKTWNSFHSYCCQVGREFVLDNIGSLFHVKQEGCE